MSEAQIVGSQPARVVVPRDRWNASSYSRGGMFPQYEYILSVLYHATHSIVASATSMTFSQPPWKSMSSFL